MVYSGLLVKEVLKWRVGNGDLIKIWKDKWLQTHTFFAVQSPRKILGENVTVVEIIDKDTRWLWWEKQQYSNSLSVWIYKETIK
jgi:hypothetical protein